MLISNRSESVLTEYAGTSFLFLPLIFYANTEADLKLHNVYTFEQLVNHHNIIARKFAAGLGLSL